jgi:hypothetical protein
LLLPPWLGSLLEPTFPWEVHTQKYPYNHLNDKGFPEHIALFKGLLSIGSNVLEIISPTVLEIIGPTVLEIIGSNVLGIESGILKHVGDVRMLGSVKYSSN